MSDLKPLARKTDIVVQEIDNEILIYDLVVNRALSLNETCGIVWRLSNGDNSISEIAAALSTKLNSPINEDFVWLALQQLQKEKLIDSNKMILSKYSGTSRRELIKRIGFGSAAALPIVCSVIAPMSVSAQSCVVPAPIGCPCTGNNQCMAPSCCGIGLVCISSGSVAPGGGCRVNDVTSCECASGVCNAMICQ